MSIPALPTMVMAVIAEWKVESESERERQAAMMAEATQPVPVVRAISGEPKATDAVCVPSVI